MIQNPLAYGVFFVLPNKLENLSQDTDPGREIDRLSPARVWFY